MSYKSPAYQVIGVPIEKIEPNSYNPNAVAPPEMKLLYESIRVDGYTMPVVCYFDQEKDKYIIVDGFHRYRVMLDHRDIYDREKGLLPVTVIDKHLDERMASTIRHNRARGSHNVDLMSNIIRELHDLGRSDEW
ncbi:MAG: ParB/RepB/Spo0J family partition protein, partial [Lachnospiraceae bacterium]|nr:ParB/RepB/Spo0J family partition protein [Lachnospiraceae bacterium]